MLKGFSLCVGGSTEALNSTISTYLSESKNNIMKQTKTMPTRTIIVPGTSAPEEAGADQFDTFDFDFDEGDQASKPITEAVRLWWFNGLPTDTDMNAIGWHIKAGINPSLDETMEAMGATCYSVQHRTPDKDGDADPKPYWRLRSCSLIFVAQRLQSQLEMNRNPGERLGLAYAWETVTNALGKPDLNKHGKPKKQTKLKARVFIHDLYRNGYKHWLPFTLTGYATNSLLDALSKQYAVLDYYAGLRQAQGKNSIAPFYLFSLPLGPGQMKWVGEPPEQGSIYPIEAKMPATIDKAYLKQHLIPLDLIEHIRSELLDETMIWSSEESEKIAGQQLALTSGSVEVAQLNPKHPARVEHDPLVNERQILWIESRYCQGDQIELARVLADFQVATVNELRESHVRLLAEEIKRQNSANQH